MSSERRVVARLLREPLLHFLLIGMAVFAAYHFAEPPELWRPIVGSSM